MAKKPASKGKVMGAVLAGPGLDEHMSMSVRKIKNGFIVHHSRSGPKGYTSHEEYHPTKPKIAMPVAKKGPK